MTGPTQALALRPLSVLPGSSPLESLIPQHLFVHYVSLPPEQKPHDIWDPACLVHC